MNDIKLNEHHERKVKLNQQIKDYMLYTGFALAGIGALSYIAIVIVMVTGFETALEVENQITFSILGAIVGLIISFSLKSQGIAFAKNEEESQRIMGAYHKALNKSKKEKELHDISHFMLWSTVKDVLFKGTSVALSTYFILNIAIQGNGNWMLILTAISNILLFLGFGLVALSKAYDKYIYEHLPVIEALTQKIIERNNKQETIDLANRQLEELGEVPFSNEEVEE